MRKLLSYILSLLVVMGLSSCFSRQAGSTGSETAGNVPESGVVVLQNQDIDEAGHYTDKYHVALYIHTYGHLPGNFIKKRQAEELGWVSSRGNLHDVAPGMSIGGDNFGNYEGQLPKAKKRRYYECDIDYGGGRRNAKRIVFSNDGLVFYTDNHYKSFDQLY